jgi:hypothetical protein
LLVSSSSLTTASCPFTAALDSTPGDDDYNKKTTEKDIVLDPFLIM